jgi:hypothetical protein
LTPELRPARTVDADTIERAAAGCLASRAFVRAYGESRRDFLESLVAPFVPDPFEGRCVFVQGGASARVLPATKLNGARRPERDRREHKKWEESLARFGLDEQTLNGSAGKQVVVIAKGSEPPLRTVDADAQLAARQGIPWQSTHAIPIQVHEREIPPWTQSDAACREFLMHLYGNAFEAGRPSCREAARRRAGRCAYVLARFFRELATAAVIAGDSGMEEIQVLRIAGKIRLHDFPNGKMRCCGRWRKTREGS